MLVGIHYQSLIEKGFHEVAVVEGYLQGVVMTEWIEVKAGRRTAMRQKRFK